MIQRFSLLLLPLAFLFLPLQAVFAEEILNTPETEVSIPVIPVYFFTDEQGGVLAIAPLSAGVFLWAYGYDADTITNAHNALQSLSYTYDAVGNITQVKDLSGFGGHKTVNYAYDDLYRLLTASTTVPANGGYNQTFTYDRIGNILASPEGTYAYAETGFTNPHGATAVGGTSLTYDDNGNVTAQGSDTYSWNYRDRLMSSTVGGVDTFYGYDHENMRVTKGDGTATTTYASKFYEISNATTTKYIWAGDVLIAQVEGTGTATTTKFVHGDHLNSTTITTDEDGDVVSAKDYLPFGSERVNTGEPIGRAYLGEYSDTETSLSYLQQRYYSGDDGKFLSQDPVFWENPARQNLLEPQSLNSYSYSENDPINNKDPTGRCVGPLAVACAGAVIAGVGTYASDVLYNLDAGNSNPYFSNLSSPQEYISSIAFGAAGGITAKAGLAFGAVVAGGGSLAQDVIAGRDPDFGKATVVAGSTYGVGKIFKGLVGPVLSQNEAKAGIVQATAQTAVGVLVQNNIIPAPTNISPQQTPTTQNKLIPTFNFSSTPSSSFNFQQGTSQSTPAVISNSRDKAVR